MCSLVVVVGWWHEHFMNMVRLPPIVKCDNSSMPLVEIMCSSNCGITETPSTQCETMHWFESLTTTMCNVLPPTPCCMPSLRTINWPLQLPQFVSGAVWMTSITNCLRLVRPICVAEPNNNAALRVTRAWSIWLPNWPPILPLIFPWLRHVCHRFNAPMG